MYALFHKNGIQRLFGLCEHVPNHGFEEPQRLGFYIRLESGRIIRLDEFPRALIAGVIPELLVLVPIHAQVVKETVALEKPVMLNHPVVVLADEGFQQHCGP